MSNKEVDKSADTLSSTATPRKDPFADTRLLISQEIPHGVDRRSFLMRSAVGGAAAVMTGCGVSPAERTAKAV
ncbi:MAG TPA: twin-arginine translocation signal domain-containing protein, partial [Vicinamibacterales bacterium]|nr:twin-arginine translocation signal domain-containing protein [Vicinamibacterales bacterium]